MPTTVKDIALSAGVSRATVSLVLRDSPLVAKSTRERVRLAIEELGYVYDRAAANLRTRSTKTIGLVVCEITNPFYAEMTAGIDDALDQAGWVAFLANTAESPVRQDRFIARMREQRVDGLLLSPAEGSDPELASRIRSAGLPVVEVLRRLDGGPGDYVGTDFTTGMKLAAEHLIKLGHKQIAYVGAKRQMSPGRDRLAGYVDALRRHGLPVGQIVHCRPTREEGAQAVDRLFEGQPTDPTAILCYNDVCAFGVMLGLADRGLVPGEDVAVLGFDNIAEAGLYRPTLSTIEIGARRIGEEAARLLLRRIAAPKASFESIVLPPRLIVRTSCGGQTTEGEALPPQSAGH
ncbi:MAG: LacI family DNA-binding transcriptional regulator [Devosia sp.]